MMSMKKDLITKEAIRQITEDPAIHILELNITHVVLRS